MSLWLVLGRFSPSPPNHVGLNSRAYTLILIGEEKLIHRCYHPAELSLVKVSSGAFSQEARLSPISRNSFEASCRLLYDPRLLTISMGSQNTMHDSCAQLLFFDTRGLRGLNTAIAGRRNMSRLLSISETAKELKCQPRHYPSIN